MVGTGLGMPDAFDVYLRAVAPTARCGHGSTGALWWERDRGLEQLPGLIARREQVAERRRPGAAADGCRQDHGRRRRRELHGRDLERLPGCDGGAQRQPRPVVHRSGRAARVRHGARRRGVRGAFPRARRSRGDRGPRRARGGARSERDPRHPVTSSRTCSSSHPPTCRDSPTLDAVANLQPLWACHEPQLDELTLPFLDPALAARHYPFGELHRAGARFAAGSDWPVSSADPLAGIRVAVTRVEAGSDRAAPRRAGAGAPARDRIRRLHERRGGR